LETEFAQFADGLSRLRSGLVGEQQPAEKSRAARDASDRTIVAGSIGYYNSQFLEELGPTEGDDLMIDAPENAKTTRLLYFFER
jgi:hypothetical protein